MGNEGSSGGIAIKNSTDQRIFVVQELDDGTPIIDWWGAVEPGQWYIKKTADNKITVWVGLLPPSGTPGFKMPTEKSKVGKLKQKILEHGRQKNCNDKPYWSDNLQHDGTNYEVYKYTEETLSHRYQGIVMKQTSKIKDPQNY